MGVHMLDDFLEPTTNPEVDRRDRLSADGAALLGAAAAGADAEDGGADGAERAGGGGYEELEILMGLERHRPLEHQPAESPAMQNVAGGKAVVVLIDPFDLGEHVARDEVAERRAAFAGRSRPRVRRRSPPRRCCSAPRCTLIRPSGNDRRRRRSAGAMCGSTFPSPRRPSTSRCCRTARGRST